MFIIQLLLDMTYASAINVDMLVFVRLSSWTILY